MTVALLLAAALAGPAAAEHEHKAPRGGCLVELGEEFAHLELLLDADGELAAYVLDGEAENPVRLKQRSLVLDLAKPRLTLTLAAKADPLTGETVGDSSAFAGKSAKLAGARAFSGAVRALTVKGSRFREAAFECGAKKAAR